MIPSRAILKDHLSTRFDIISSQGINTLGELISSLKTKPLIEAFAQKSKLSVDYLTILKREASSYLPNPVQLKQFSGVDTEVVSELGKRGINSSRQLFDRADELRMLSSDTGVPSQQIRELMCLSDLCRLYGVGPVFARILYDIGIDSVQTLAAHSGAEIVDIYEDQTQKTADFSARDIEFTLELARDLDIITPPDP